MENSIINLSNLLVLIQEHLGIEDCRYGSGYSGNLIRCIKGDRAIRIAISHVEGITDLQTAALMQHRGELELEEILFDTNVCPGYWTYHHEMIKVMVMRMAKDSTFGFIPNKDEINLNLELFKKRERNSNKKIMVSFKTPIKEGIFTLEADAPYQASCKEFRVLSIS